MKIYMVEQAGEYDVIIGYFTSRKEATKVYQTLKEKDPGNDYFLVSQETQTAFEWSTDRQQAGYNLY